MLLKRILPVLVLLMLAACHTKVDTSNMSPEQHYAYAMQLFNDEDYEYAIVEFKVILLNNVASAIYPDAQFYLGMSYFKREQYYLAAYEFSKLIRDIPTSKYVPDSQFMLAESYYQQSPHYTLDQAFSKSAIKEFQTFIDYFPTNPKSIEAEKKIKELNEKLAQKDFYSAQQYERMTYNFAALKYYTQVVETYHDTKYGPEALYRKIRLEIDKGQNDNAKNDVSLFYSRYPGHSLTSDVKDLEAKIEKK